MRGASRRRTASAAAAAAAALLAGCGGEQSTLNPKSTQASDISTLFWGMLAVASIVFLGAVGMLVVAALRRARGLPFIGQRERVTTGLVILFGMVIPIVVLIAVFVVGNIYVMPATSAPPKGSTKLTVQVVGHQWFWEFRYPGRPTAVTANELHIPTGTRVEIQGTTGDVIHSFWVPQLNRKIDLIPGRTNRILLYTNTPGVYRGQCAEFCGYQHAHMAMAVFAQRPDRFRAWLQNEARPARKPTTAAQRAGEQAFMSNQCASCHTIRGTKARGDVGPDLTHFASRTTLAAYTLRNTPNNVARWIDNPQAIKPGNRMPKLDLTRSQVGEIVPYLESLK